MKAQGEKVQSSKVIADSKKQLNDNEILNLLEKANKEQTTKKTAESRSIWKNEIKAEYKTEKTARRKLRAEQLKLSDNVKKALNLNNASDIKLACAALETFYKKVLVNFDNYSNLSEDSKHYFTIHVAYSAMKKQK